MNDSKWADVLDKVESQFAIEERGIEELGDVPNGKLEFVVFTSPMGRIRLERETRPRVESTKTIGGSKYGAASMVEKVYSHTDTVNDFAAWREVGGEWEPMNADGLI